jgi:hypothetical protein
MSRLGTAKKPPVTVTAPPPDGLPSDRRAALPLAVSGARRRPMWVVLGVLVIGASALLGLWVVSSATDRVTVMVAAHDLAPGVPIAAEDLRVVEMGRAGQLRAVESSQQSLIVGRVPRGPVPAGTVLNTDLFTGTGAAIPPGQVVVGASLDPGATPVPNLRTGDPVSLLVTPKATGGATTPPAAATRLGAGSVWTVETAGPGGKVWVSVLVAAELETAVAQAAAEGTLRLALAGETSP